MVTTAELEAMYRQMSVIRETEKAAHDLFLASGRRARGGRRRCQLSLARR
jgi:TPP-dependent pyruvate/acetoin dehydrogenase alpha subunit